MRPDIKTVMSITKEQMLQENPQVTKNIQWMTNKTWKLVTQRKTLIQSDTPNDENENRTRIEHRRLNREIRLCRRDKNDHPQNMCS